MNEIGLDGQKVKYYRLKVLHLTQKDFAKVSRVDQGQISRIETGKRKNVEFATLAKLAAAFKVDVSDLIIRTPENEDEVKKLKAIYDSQFIKNLAARMEFLMDSDIAILDSLSTQMVDRNTQDELGRRGRKEDGEQHT